MITYTNSTGIHLVTFAIFAVFADISGSLLASSFPLSCYIRYFSVLASVKNSSYFSEIFGHFGVLFRFFFSNVVNLVTSVILEIFERGAFASKKNPCYLCDFCDICGYFEALLSFFFFLLSLESRYFCYSCDFCDICDASS